MIKYFCDKCNKEINHDTTFVIKLFSRNPDNVEDFIVCERCYNNIKFALKSCGVSDPLDRGNI